MSMREVAVPRFERIENNLDVEVGYERN